MPSFSSQSAICCIAAPYKFNAIRSGPSGQKVYDTRQLIVSSSGRGRCFARKNNPDFSELTGLRIDLYRPRMLLDDDVVSDGQAKARAFPSGFCREEGIEHFFPDLRRNARTVVANRNRHAVAKVLRRSCKRRLVRIATVLFLALGCRIEAVGFPAGIRQPRRRLDPRTARY